MAEPELTLAGSDTAGHGAPVQSGGAHPREQAHPGPMEYIAIALVLGVITLIEVAIYYIDALDDVLTPILIVLSATKFCLVALWFMHLKFDSRFFSALFVGGIILAASVFISAWATLDILM